MPDFAPLLIRKFYSEDLLLLAQKQINALKAANYGDRDETNFGRLYVHNHPFFVALHEIQQAKVERILSRELKKSYCFLSMYFEGRGKCERHIDRPQCKYTVDVCFNQREIWPFYAEYQGRELQFDMEPGDALILSGTQHPHWRKPIQAGNFCDLAFFHYVDPTFIGDLS